MANLPKSSLNGFSIDEKTQDLGNVTDVRANEAAIDVATANADDALKYAAAEAVVLDEATQSRLLRTTDQHVLPWLCALYFIQSIDKGTCKFKLF